LQAFNQELFRLISRLHSFYSIFKRLLTLDMACITEYIKLRGAVTYTGTHH